MPDAISLDGVVDNFYYDETSPTCLRWKHDRGLKIKANSVAGGKQTDGYMGVKFGYRDYLCHRIVWSIFNGNLERHQKIDHINRDKSDNRISNLRIATVSQNTANQDKQPGKTSKFKGVTWCRKSRKWKATIKEPMQVNSKHLGMFLQDASAAYAYDWAAKYYFGEFARLNFPNGIYEVASSL